MSCFSVFFFEPTGTRSAYFIDKEEKKQPASRKKKTFTSERSVSPGTLRLRRAKEKILPLS
jgi:hypothetical protein